MSNSIREKEIFETMFNIQGSDDLIKEIESIMDEEDLMVSEENTPVKLRKKYRKEINELFELKSMNCQDLFSLAFLIINEFNINPESFIMCLSRNNREKLKNYAHNNYDTTYLRKKEKIIVNEKREKKGMCVADEAISIKDFFV